MKQPNDKFYKSMHISRALIDSLQRYANYEKRSLNAMLSYILELFNETVVVEHFREPSENKTAPVLSDYYKSTLVNELGRDNKYLENFSGVTEVLQSARPSRVAPASASNTEVLQLDITTQSPGPVEESAVPEDAPTQPTGVETAREPNPFG